MPSSMIRKSFYRLNRKLIHRVNGKSFNRRLKQKKECEHGLMRLRANILVNMPNLVVRITPNQSRRVRQLKSRIGPIMLIECAG